MLVELDVIPSLLECLSPNVLTRNDIAAHSVSASTSILGYLIDGNHKWSVAFLDQMERHNAAGKLLGLCHQDQASMVVCTAIDLLKKMTKTSPRIFQSIMDQNGPSIIVTSLRMHRRLPEVVKYASLLLARWGAIPGMADRLESSGVFEALWEVISSHGYDSKAYAYAVCGICVLSIDRVEKLCRMLTREGTSDIIAFCSAIKHYDHCFQKHSIVHHTIWQAISSGYGSRIVLKAARLGLLEILASWETNCNLILSVIASLVESIQEFENNDAILASFLVKKMPQYPEEAVRALFYGNSPKNCLVDKLVEQSFRHLVQENENSEGESSHVLYETDMLTSEPSIDSLALLIEDNEEKGYQHEVRSITGLGAACFEAFTGTNICLGSTVILCKVLAKLRAKMGGVDSPNREEKEEPTPKRFKSSSCDGIITFRVGDTLISTSKEVFLKESRVASLLLEDSDSEVEVHGLNHLSTEGTVYALKIIFAWCKNKQILEDMSLGEIQLCWIAADYLDMSDEFTDYLFAEKLEPRLSMSSEDDRAHVYTWLSSLCRMFLGAESLNGWAARCIAYEFGQCEMSLDRIPNLEYLKEFAQLDGMSAAVTAHLRSGFLGLTS